MDRRIAALAEQVEANVISRRQVSPAGGDHHRRHRRRARTCCARWRARRRRPKLRVWLFKSFVTDCNEILAKHIEAWAKERKVDVEFDWATFGDREQKFVAAIEAGNPPDVAEMNYQGPMRYRPALRDVTKLAKEIAGARGGLLPYADRVVQFNGQYFGVAHQAFGGGLHIRKDLVEAKGLEDAQGLRSRRDRRRQEVPGPVEGPLGLRPDPQPLRRRQRVHAEHPLGLRRERLGQGRQARPRAPRS